MTSRLSFALLAMLALAGCSSEPSKKSAEAERQGGAATTPPAATTPAPAEPGSAGEKTEKPEKADTSAQVYKVKFTTSKGPVLIEVHRDWAPIGAQRFHDLVKAGYYDGARFFRVVPGFIVQFGIAGSPAMTKKWDKRIKDDPVTQTNRRGSLAFATMGPGTRTAQVFINTASNQSLDGQGFAPFAMVTEGMDLVDQFYRGYGESPNQGLIESRGNAYLESSFPKLDFIKKAELQ